MRFLAAIAVVAMTSSANAADPVLLHAAGSLRGALTDVLKAFDPSGDYAFEVFAKAGALKAGSRAALEKKALQLTGGPSSAQPLAGRSVYGWHVAEGRADIFLTYCTNAVVAVRENPGQQMIDLPEALAVGADYGLTVMNGATARAQDFAKFILSREGQGILQRHGFSAPGL